MKINFKEKRAGNLRSGFQQSNKKLTFSVTALK
jgi:hypothetical protein